MTSIPARASTTLGARARSRRSPRAPFILLGAGLAVSLALLQIPSEVPTDLRLRAALLLQLYLIPAAIYAARARESRPPLPTLAILGLVHATYYALPPLAGVVNAAYLPGIAGTMPYVDPVWDLPAALDLALWGWIALLAGFAVASPFLTERRAVARPLNVAKLIVALWLIAAVGLGAEALGATMQLPVVLGGTIGFVKLAGRYVLTVLLALRTRGELPRGHGKYLTACIIIELILLATTGSMANPMTFGLTLSFGFWIAGGRLRPQVVGSILVAVLIGVVLKGVAAEYRQRTWWVSEQVTQVERTAVMRDLVADQLQTEGVSGAVVLGAQASMRRSATLDMLADVMRRTPREVPYWGGRTYYSLIGAFIPRFLWPTKPTKNIGNEFGHRYGYIGSHDTWTEVNMPFMLEFYANFGFSGVLIGMFLTAFIIRLLDVLLNRAGSSVLRAVAALMIIQPIFLIESDFSLVFGGLIMNGIAMLLLVRQLEKRAAVRARAAAVPAVPPVQRVS
ncbi:MAG: hypothetical protein ACJ79K_17160 [Gemmatimonadaceae bacterium]